MLFICLSVTGINKLEYHVPAFNRTLRITTIEVSTTFCQILSQLTQTQSHFVIIRSITTAPGSLPSVYQEPFNKISSSSIYTCKWLHSKEICRICCQYSRYLHWTSIIVFTIWRPKCISLGPLLLKLAHLSISFIHQLAQRLCAVPNKQTLLVIVLDIWNWACLIVGMMINILILSLWR